MPKVPNIIVNDNGTGFVKCGFAGENFPTGMFPATMVVSNFDPPSPASTPPQTWGKQELFGLRHVKRHAPCAFAIAL